MFPEHACESVLLASGTHGRVVAPTRRVYDLRHTFASHLLALGAPITYVAAQLGHAKPTMTLAAYAHWLPRGDRALADRLEVLRTNDAAHRPQAVRKDLAHSAVAARKTA